MHDYPYEDDLESVFIRLFKPDELAEGKILQQDETGLRCNHPASACATTILGLLWSSLAFDCIIAIGAFVQSSRKHWSRFATAACGALANA